MALSIKSILVGTMLAALFSVSSASAEVVKTVTVKQYHPGVHRVIVVHPNYHVYKYRHHHRHHNGDWRYHHRNHHDHWRHHRRHHRH